jgi:ribosomal-protein-alanine N-acetyltransferase
VHAPSDEELGQLARIPSAVPFLKDRFLVIREGEEIAAFVAWRAVSLDETEGNEFEILQLETNAAFRRRGFARKLIRRFLEQNPGNVFLEVREGNVAARQLYEKEGFTEIGRRREYYSAPLEDAIVLKFRSC